MDKAALSDITVFNKYAKFVPHLGRRENWSEIIERNAQMHREKYPSLADKISAVYRDFVLPKKALPSMRALQFGGRPITLNHARIYNCAYMPAEGTKFFSELMFLLLGGTGVGYSVQQRHVGQLPKVKAPESDQEYKFQIQDSIIGWADAVKVLCKAFFNAGTLPVFDYRDIREKGSDLITTGGKAPGPEPLRLCLERIEPILRGAIGRRLRPLEVHDIACAIADSVRAGGIRRAAMICLFDRWDEEMLTCKSGEWYIDHPARARANNSAVLPRGEVSQDEFARLMDRIKASGCGEPGIYWTNDKDWGTNPCCFAGDSEILTAEGYVAIKELDDEKEHDFINAYGDTVKGTVWKTGVKKLLKIKTGNTKSPVIIRATGDHQFMLANGETEVAENLLGKRLMPFISMKRFEQSLAAKYGFTFGDGAFRSNPGGFKNLSVSFTPEKDDEVAALFERQGCSTSATSFTVDVSYEEMAAFGIDTSKRTFDRVLPAINDKDMLKDFLTGMYSANGCVVKGSRVAYKTTSKPVAEGLLEWLAQLGFKSAYITTNKAKVIAWQNGDYVSRESYDVNLCSLQDVVLFAKDISFIQSYKQQALDDLIMTKAPYVFSIEADGEEEVYDFNLQDETHWGVVEGVVAHNCEIALRPYQMCNLTEINAGAVTDQASYNAAARAAAFLGTLQAGYTDFHYLNPKWRITCEKDALLGVSMTGIASGTIDRLDMEEAAWHAQDENAEVAKAIGIRPAARVTTVKPAGTTSLVAGTSSGIHAWHAPYYIRRMRAGKDEALAQYMAKAAPTLVEDDVTDPKQVVLSFPQKAPAGAVMRDEPMLNLLERVKAVSQMWVAPGHTRGPNRHNVSCTISVKDDEWDTLGAWMWDNREHYAGISVLPYFGAEAYPQLPFEDITREQYEALLPHLEGIDIGQVFERDGDGVDLAAEAACAGGVCEMQF